MDTSLAELDKVQQLLVKANDLYDVKDIMDFCDTAYHFAVAKKNGDIANAAMAGKIRSQHKAGELLAMLERGEEGRPKLNQPGLVSPYLSTLEAQEIAPTTAKRWEQVAKIEPEVLEQRIAAILEDGGELTTAGILKDAPHVTHNSGENEWYTPPEYILAAKEVLGEIDLDPASSKKANSYVGAKRFYTQAEDGLTKEWSGTVWMNPPYEGKLIKQFAAKFAEHVSQGDIRAGIVLVNNATETEWFGTLVDCAAAIVFTSGRVKFLDMNGDPKGAPLQGQAFIYFGKAPKKFLAAFSGFGWGAIL